MEKRLADIAKLIDHSLLHPTLTDAQIKAGCELAKKYGVASVCVKPYAVAVAKKELEGSSVAVGTVVGFPHGSSAIKVKVAEAHSVCKDGASELDIVINIGKVLSKDWQYVSDEIATLCAMAKAQNALIKVIFENDFLDCDTYKEKLCELCNQHKPDFIKTSTGYGFVKGSNGVYSYRGAVDSDLVLMRKHADPSIQIKAAGGVRTLEDVLRVQALGVTRIGASATEAIMQEAVGAGYQ